MDYLTFLSILEDPLPWIAVLLIIGLALASVGFLWFFRVKRLLVLKDIACPEVKRRAVVELIAQLGEPGGYHDVRRCYLLELGKNLNCHKACLMAPEVLTAPFLVVKKLWSIAFVTQERRGPSDSF